MKIDALVEEYIGIRDHLDTVRKKYKAFEEERKTELAQIEAQILDISNDTGVESFRTNYGTAFRTMKDYARVLPGEREAVDQYVLESGNTQIFTSHLSKIAVKELMEDGLNPASVGVDYIQEDVIQVRRPTKGK